MTRTRCDAPMRGKSNFLSRRFIDHVPTVPCRTFVDRLSEENSSFRRRSPNIAWGCTDEVLRFQVCWSAVSGPPSDVVRLGVSGGCTALSALARHAGPEGPHQTKALRPCPSSTETIGTTRQSNGLRHRHNSRGRPLGPPRLGRTLPTSPHPKAPTTR